MSAYNLDQIVKRYLLDHSLPMHFYVQALSAGSAALRELTFDTLKVINTVVLTPSPTFSVDLPCDYVDWTKVGVQVGQLIKPIAPLESINNLVKTNKYGQPELYTQLPSEQDVLYINGVPFNGWYWLWPNYSALWENLGGMYGTDNGRSVQGFKVIPERNQIQLTESFGCGNLYLEYISDGQNCNSATKIDSRAWNAIQSYIAWKMSVNADRIKSPEGYTWANERRLLRKRLSDMSIESVRASLWSSYRAAIKN